MTQVSNVSQVSYELPTATGAFRAARIAFIQARWHADIVDKAREGFVAEIATLGFPEGLIDVFDTPGAFEIPLHAQTLARTGKYAAVIGAGLVVDGGVYRHEFVAQAVIQGLMQVQLATDTPVFSVVLTPHQYQETAAHKAFFQAHFVQKGAEAARACAATLASLSKLAAAA